jgi:hypothetical protein
MVTKTAWHVETAKPIPTSHALAIPGADPARIERLRPAEPQIGDYIKLAAELGLSPDLRLCLMAQGVRVFDYEAVCQHMESLAMAEGVRWFWNPLRLKDGECPHMEGYRTGDGDMQGFTFHWLRHPYAHTVPLHVLERVAKIEREFTGRAFFFVSDYAAPDPDPYLMVTDGRGTPFVTDRWAEPSWQAVPLREVWAASPARTSGPSRRQEPRRGKPFAAVLAYWTILGMLVATAGWCVAHMARAYGVLS